MKIKLWVCYLLLFFISCDFKNEQNENKNNDQEYNKLNTRLSTGWNTWNTWSVLSHVLLPESLSLDLQLVNHQSGDTLKDALIGREGFGSKEHVVPGPHTYDGSYAELVVEWQDIRVQVQSAEKNNQFFLLVTPLEYKKGDTLMLNPKMLWDRQGEIMIKDGKITTNTSSGIIEVTVLGGQFSSTNENIKFSLSKEIVISTDSSKSTGDIKTIINDARSKILAERSKYNNVSELYNAIQNVLAWNTIYEPTENRVITPVSRNWNVGWKGWVLFDWDTYFAAYMLSLDNKDLSYANAIAMTHDITEKGFIPNFSSSICKSEDRSQPPVGSFVVKEIYRKYQEKWFLEEVFDELLSWNRWWDKNRNIDGYLCWGSDPYVPEKISEFLRKGIGTRKGAKWESGMDNSPMWDDAVFDTTTHRLLLADVGLMSVYISDCQSLAEIAEVLDKPEIANELKDRAKKYSAKLATLWDDKFGLYLNKDLTTGKFSYRLSPTLFYPLLAKVPDQQQANRMIKEHFYNPQEFWGEYIMPSIARNDTSYRDNKYWRGRIWSPLNFLVYLGMRNYDMPDAKKDMAEKSKNLLLKSWIGENHIYENYNADTGQGDDAGMSDGFYHWGSLLGFIDIMEKGYVASPQLPLK
jgi:neutral trehalase